MIYRVMSLLSLIIVFGCRYEPTRVGRVLEMHEGELNYMLGTNHAWAGSWVLFWSGDSVEVLQMDDRGFIISQGGDWILMDRSGRYQQFNCLRDLGNDKYVYERLEGPRAGNVNRRSYVTMARYSVDVDPEMLCDQLWRSRYYPTQDQANGSEVNIPYASRESMTRYWTPRKLEGFPLCFFCSRWLLHCFCRCKKQEPPQSGGISGPRIARAEDLMDGRRRPTRAERKKDSVVSAFCHCPGACNCGINPAVVITNQPTTGLVSTIGTWWKGYKKRKSPNSTEDNSLSSVEEEDDDKGKRESLKETRV